MVNIEEKLNKIGVDKNQKEVQKLLVTLIDQNGYLLQSKFLEWFDSVFQKAKNELTRVDRGIFKLSVDDFIYNVCKKNEIHA